MEEIINQAYHYRLRMHRKARGHYLMSKSASKKHVQLGVPVIALSTIVGAGIFSTLSNNPAITLKVIAGLISLLAAVLASLQTFFNFSEIADKHRVFGAQNAILTRRIDSFVLRVSNLKLEKEEAFKELDLIVSEWNQLELESLDVLDKYYEQATKEQYSQTQNTSSVDQDGGFSPAA